MMQGNDSIVSSRPDDEERERVKASVYAALRVLSGVRKGGFVPILYQSEEDF